MNLQQKKGLLNRSSNYVVAIISICIMTFACATQKPYNHQTCMDTTPKKAPGLTILSGPRTEQSIIRDMVPVGCYGRVIYERMKSHGENISPGVITFRVTVEYTGEVYGVEVVDATIPSQKFVRRISDMIKNTDFVGWARSDDDTVFIYPLRFGT